MCIRTIEEYAIIYHISSAIRDNTGYFKFPHQSLGLYCVKDFFQIVNRKVSVGDSGVKIDRKSNKIVYCMLSLYLCVPTTDDMPSSHNIANGSLTHTDHDGESLPI